MFRIIGYLLAVCHNRRIPSHKVFAQVARRGKNSADWFYGFKLHLTINEQGERLAFRLTPGNVDNRVPVPEIVKGLFGKLFGTEVIFPISSSSSCLPKACTS
jgi:hypothetical protein